ncbi:hypothetical protein L1765_04925 [Microaerobacter geothermalis]|uniref:hypothetical protein n=1 Tax=Microaerobacter geothermalis TaxID=674972 RepID=UPI001F3AF7AA|nr:hypothetical protein [Microaerobacter geothermalis]MCF6093339.1 hypothetical protein [Microaerobacter geothermalis]
MISQLIQMLFFVLIIIFLPSGCSIQNNSSHDSVIQIRITPKQQLEKILLKFEEKHHYSFEMKVFENINQGTASLQFIGRVTDNGWILTGNVGEDEVEIKNDVSDGTGNISVIKNGEELEGIDKDRFWLWIPENHLKLMSDNGGQISEGPGISVNGSPQQMITVNIPLNNLKEEISLFTGSEPAVKNSLPLVSEEFTIQYKIWYDKNYDINQLHLVLLSNSSQGVEVESILYQFKEYTEVL